MEGFFGLDIGSHQLKLVELKEGNQQFELLTFGHSATPPNTVYSESDVDRKQLAEAIRKLVVETGVGSRQVVTAFPESQVFTRVIEVPELTHQELGNVLKYEAENYLPLPVSDVKLDYTILERGIIAGDQRPGDGEKNLKMRVLLVAAPNNLIERYYETLRWAGLEPIALETELLSIKRSLISEERKGLTTMLLSIGATTADLCVVHEGRIQLTRSIGTGGEALAKAISQQLGFEMDQAEEYKKSYGLKEDQLEGKIMQIIKPVFDVVVNEVERAVINFQSKNPSRPVRRVVLTGGTAQLPGLVVYLAESLDLEVQIGNPWERVVLSKPEHQEAIKEVEAQVNFAVAVGLAMKDVTRLLTR